MNEKTGDADLKPAAEARFETAGEHMVTRVPVAAPGDLVGSLRASLAGRHFTTLATVAVVDEGRLVGLVGIDDLMAAAPDTELERVMDAAPPVVGPDADQEVAVWQAVRRGEPVVAVVDDQGGFLGLLPPERMLAVLAWEHEEDMARIGGSLHDAAAAREASREPVSRRLWHRLPWLIVGLAGALGAALLLDVFEDRLRGNVALVFFIPGITYMADAVGTQTEAIVIRGLSVGVSVADVVRRELVTGVMVGLSVAAIFLPIALWQWPGDVAFAAALALLMACSTATVVAMALPWLLHRLGKDPAFGSGPLATVIQDLASIVIYVGVIVLVVG